VTQPPSPLAQAEILSLSVPDYEKLSAECVAIAQRYRWPEIANNTITHYPLLLTR
jgi:hypothetical protein